MTVQTSCIDRATQRTARSRTHAEFVEIAGERILVHSYRPAGAPEGPILILFAGYERNGEDYMRRARRAARRHQSFVLAPVLDADRFPPSRYQRAGAGRRPPDAGSAHGMGAFVAQLVHWARARDGRCSAPVILFGHSAGAQMLSRVAAYWGMSGAQRIVLANPSSYVAPSGVERSPYGFAGDHDVVERDRRIQAYLALPMTIYLGSEDTGAHLLDARPAAMRQGINRLDRGRRIYAQGRALAAARGWRFGWRLVVAEGVEHSSRGMLAAPELDDALAGLNAIRLSSP